MAIKKFNKDQLSRGKSILNPDDNFNPDDFTYDVITEFENNPRKENLPKVIEVIEKDSSLPVIQKEILITRLKADFVTLFGFNNIPDDYKSLKNEAKFLSDITQYSFASLAVRLKKIRDDELYKEDNYPDFKSFIDKELSINRTTAYNYIDLVTIFGVQTFEHVTEPSKLISALPLLKSANTNKDIPLAKIKKDIIKQSQTMSARELNEHIKGLKVEYGFRKSDSEKPAEKSTGVINQLDVSKNEASWWTPEMEADKKKKDKLKSTITVKFQHNIDLYEGYIKQCRRSKKEKEQNEGRIMAYQVAISDLKELLKKILKDI
ncbi:MAG: hypothetical protein CVV49_01220 [Spirochaetae bacterium HGW-Spirochaetae-5]|nr:MAG: hypothetical protein CVV49_01220 [Spirochaetae bacterium HGW-Spirochaetae-5]